VTRVEEKNESMFRVLSRFPGALKKLVVYSC